MSCSFLVFTAVVGRIQVHDRLTPSVERRWSIVEDKSFISITHVGLRTDAPYAADPLGYFRPLEDRISTHDGRLLRGSENT